ncbi:hypothetical protein JW933_01860, partial [candidate division FCPU426 bacterium]|nr:hypothetical protein [candidate division FCPU426 bacterium]
MNERMCITKTALCNALGQDANTICQALRDNQDGIAPYVSSLPELSQASSGQVRGTLPPPAPSSSFRGINRSGLLACHTARALLQKCGWEEMPAAPKDNLGVALGFNPNIHAEKVRRLLFERDYRAMNPHYFLNFTPNSTADHVARLAGARGFAYTLTNGGTSGLEALFVAEQMLRAGCVQSVLAGGVQEASDEFVHGFAFGAGENNPAGALMPWRPGAITTGEGCALLCCEMEKQALARGADIRARVLGFGMRLDPRPDAGVQGRAVRNAILAALQEAGCKALDIDAVFLAANGDTEQDQAEANALSEIFASQLPPTVAVKGALGETLHAGGAINAGLAILCLEQGFIPGTKNLADGPVARQ